MRKNGWETPTSGPDWIDVEAAMRFLGALHTGVVAFRCSPCGTGANGGLKTEMRIELNVLPGSSVPPVVSIEGKWPCPECSTLTRHALGAVYRLDAAIELEYKNSSPWE